jgi:NADPH-dependent 2,4-dienoyl-CoA reductase/sulfur reductase-like enzyme
VNRTSAEVLIIGAGPAGLAAASVTASPAKVILIDDNPFVGGQIWRAELSKQKDPTARTFVEAIERGRASVFSNTSVVDVTKKTVHAVTPNGPVKIEFEKLIIATGARELFLPFPGWTLPGVFGAGGLQSLVKGGLHIKGKRIVVAGTGPLLLAVAEYLKRKGANVRAIVEQASAAKINRFAVRLLSRPPKLAQAIKMRFSLFGIPYFRSSWVSAAHGDEYLQSVVVIINGKQRSIDCDYLACGFHLVPNTEIAQLLGCRLENGFVKVDEHQQTSVENVFCAGEPTGIAGVDSAIFEGLVAGLAATRTRQNDFAQKSIDFAEKSLTLGTERRFGEAMNTAFTLRDELRHLASDDTFVCRCEDVKYGRLKEFVSFREAKLQTRCGMGSCQGRICGAATQFLFGWEPPSVRPPIFPVKMENL